MVGPYAGRRLAARLGLLILLTLGTAAAACRGSHTPTLSDLGGVSELKERFTRDADQPRIVLLLSPT